MASLPRPAAAAAAAAGEIDIHGSINALRAAGDGGGL